MMRCAILSTFCCLLLVGCTSNYALKSVDYNELFTDGNSKVWVINKMIVNNVNVSRHGLKNKEIFIFHESGTIDYLALKAIGLDGANKGRFYLDSDQRLLSITIDKKEWRFKLSVLEEDRIVMRPEKKGSAPFTLELVPIPEL